MIKPNKTPKQKLKMVTPHEFWGLLGIILSPVTFGDGGASIW